MALKARAHLETLRAARSQASLSGEAVGWRPAGSVGGRTGTGRYVGSGAARMCCGAALHPHLALYPWPLSLREEGCERWASVLDTYYPDTLNLKDNKTWWEGIGQW